MSTRIVILLALAGVTSLITPAFADSASKPSTLPQSNPTMESRMPQREKGDKIDITVFAHQDTYASFPGIIRTDQELVLTFDAQDLTSLRAAKGIHPHHQPAARAMWAVSRNGGFTWTATDQPPALGKVLDATYGTFPLRDGRLLTLAFSRADYRTFRFISDSPIPHYHDFSTAEQDKAEVGDLGPFKKFRPHQITRLSDGTLLAAGYSAYDEADVPVGVRPPGFLAAPATAPAYVPAGSMPTPPTSPLHYTAVFLASDDDGVTWKYRSHVHNDYRFSLCEPAVLGGENGSVIAVFRGEWHNRKQDLPDDVGVDGFAYGYYLYQTESSDFGGTWSKPQRLKLWGHPPYLLRLAGGNVLMVFAQRRVPHAILGILSRDDGKTWDPRTLRAIRVFDPGSYDMGYPVATQLDDGSILCAYYNYSSDNFGEKMPHGIFATIFDEEFLAGQKGK